METFVTADDFGLNQKASHAIVGLALEKKLDYISLLVNMPSTKEAVELYKKNRLDNLGLHFNLVEGKPLTDKRLVPSLVDKRGKFHILPVFLLRLFFGMINLKDVLTELKAQLDFFKKNGLTPSHINTHQNIHIFPPLYTLVSNTAKAYKIEYVRQPSSVVRRLKKFHFKIIAFYILNWLFEWQYGNIVTVENKRFEEILCHPGTDYD